MIQQSYFDFSFNYSEVIDVKYEPDPEIKQTKMADLKENIVPFYLKRVDAIAAENNGYLALGRVCACDELSSKRFFLPVKFTLRIFFPFISVDLG